MTAPTIRIPATDVVDHRARAYNGTQALADLTQHLDPRLRVSLSISTFGKLEVLLHDDATRSDAIWMAHRLGLPEYTETHCTDDWVLHDWSGAFAGFAVRVAWFDQSGADQ